MTKSWLGIFLFATVFCSYALAGTVTMPTDTGTIDIDSANFANAVVGSSLSSTAALFGPGNAFSSGPFTSAQAAPYVVGSDLTKGVSLGQGPVGGIADYIVPGFGLVSIINGAGYDFVLWEAGAPAEDFYLAVSINGGASFSGSILYNTLVTNPLVTTPPYNINVGFVDLADFGLAADAEVDAIKVSGLFTGIGGSGPDLLALAALNAGPPTGNVPGVVPEPTTLVLISIGLIGVGIARYRKNR